jgi:anaphase-promoting complex subunit 10
MKKVSVSQICLYCDYTLDESYTVKKVCIRSGTTIHDLVDITTIELNDPKGWVIVDLTDSSSQAPNMLPLRTHLLQIRIVSMHQNGRDTHIRQIKVLGPRETPVVMADTRLDAFKTNEMVQFALLR